MSATVHRVPFHTIRLVSGSSTQQLAHLRIYRDHGTFSGREDGAEWHRLVRLASVRSAKAMIAEHAGAYSFTTNPAIHLVAVHASPQSWLPVAC